MEAAKPDDLSTMQGLGPFQRIVPTPARSLSRYSLPLCHVMEQANSPTEASQFPDLHLTYCLSMYFGRVVTIHVY